MRYFTTLGFCVQVVMIDQSLSYAGVTGVKSAVDVGCGVGGSSRHIVGYNALLASLT